VVTSAAKRKSDERAAAAPEEVEEVAPLLKEADADFEKLLAEEEAIERSVREHHETPHFRPGDGD
jgi:small subunit ribosomal protein S3